MKGIIIDGRPYEVGICGHEQLCEVIDKYAERTDDGVLHHEVLGVYFNFSLEFEPIRDPYLHNTFYDDLTSTKPSRRVTLPGMYTTYTFDCYIRVDPVKMVRHKGAGNYYEGIKCRLISISPAKRG